MSTQLDDKLTKRIEELVAPYKSDMWQHCVRRDLVTLATELQAAHTAALQAKDTEIARLREAIAEAIKENEGTHFVVATRILEAALSPNPEAKASV